MNHWFEQFVEQFLAKQAKLLIDRLKPEVVAVTGSVGKTTTKELIAHILGSRLPIRASQKSQNSTLGVPLTVLGLEPGTTPLSWLSCLVAAWRAARSASSVPLIIAEVGADKIGDIVTLGKLLKPKKAVILAVALAHLDQNAGQATTLTELAHEKGSLAEVLPKEGLLVLNRDDSRVMRMSSRTNANVVTFGQDHPADLRASHVHISLQGTSFELKIKTGLFGLPEAKSIRIETKLIGQQFVPDVLAAIAISLSYGFSLSEIKLALDKFSAQPGRMRPLAGKRGMILLDDTYNANPLSMASALQTLVDVRVSGRRVAILGNMNELGAFAADAHQQIGKQVAELPIDYLATVGEQGAWIGEAAVANGLPAGQYRHFPTTENAMTGLPLLLRPKDTVLLKASQNGMRLERLVKVLMLHADQAATELVRQGSFWENR